MSMKQFGKVAGLPRPRTEQDLHRLYLQHQYKLKDGISRLVVNWSKSGPGHAGARHFWAYKCPPIRHWNEQVTVERNFLEPGIKPTLVIESNDATPVEIDLTGLHQDQILADVLESYGVKDDVNDV
eukprot:TRINITY_DN4477_c1_g1_i1.p1 TRINITY_DN4477_c1_g1~~TRINITY_DN4477_c1_g1_i1.p1  ORF type:complete len:126 (+),score=10.90 TRINITY_DN4477_c1_g1_i1:90-467(+)